LPGTHLPTPISRLFAMFIFFSNSGLQSPLLQACQFATLTSSHTCLGLA
jgi:hypothetical protein